MKLLDLSYFSYTLTLYRFGSAYLSLIDLKLNKPFIVSTVTNLHVGYYGLVIVRPQTFHRSQGNIKYPFWIASIFYMYIDLSERITGKQDAPSHIAAIQPPPPPPISKHLIFYIVAHIWKTPGYFFLCYGFVCYMMRSYCPENVVTLG